ncbi:protein DBF4 homolog A isoform X2 [Syngnathus acus]|nr:protein DBF4 homolog A isoform X2 [Syngnathus acus]
MKLSVKSHLALLKPLTGKVFYLDLLSNRKAESLERDIKHLGGSVDKFFSKDITYLVSNKRETKYVQCRRQDFPFPSPQSASSPCPHSNQPQPVCGCDNTKNRSQGQADSFVTSCGRSSVEKTVKEQGIFQTDKILSKALEWGVKIFYIDEVLAYIKKKKKTIASQCPITAAAKTTVKHASTAELTCQESKGGRIGKPFVKVEDSSRHYRPIYVTMPKMPELNLKTLAPRCPFVVTGEKSAGDKQRVNKTVKATGREGQASGRKNNKDKEGSGYCQCCMDKYENLISHLQSERHRAFSKSEAYQVLNQLVSPLQRSFTSFNTFIKRHKSSVSSVQLDTGPFRGLDIRATEMIKEEQQPNDCPMESFPFPSTSGLQSATQLPTSLTASLSSNLRRVSHKRPRRRNLMTLSPPKAAQEMRPSSGESLARSPVLIPQVNVDVHVPHEDTRSPQEPLCESYLGSPSAVTNQQEDTNRRKRPPGKAVGNGEHLSPPSCSPVETVRRKVRVYKRQKWKFDTTHEEHVKQNDTCDNSPERSGNFFSPLIKGDVELAQI